MPTWLKVSGPARLEFNKAGTTAAPTVTTTELQTYNDAAMLGANVVLQSTGGGNLTFNRTVNGAFAMEVNTAGNQVFNGRVGDAVALMTSLTTDASNLGGNTRINAPGTTIAPSVTTTAFQTINDGLVLGADVVLQSTLGGDVAFKSTVNSDVIATPRALTVKTAGVTGFGDGGADNVGARRSCVRC